MIVTHALSTPNTYFLFRNDGFEVVINYNREGKIYKTNRKLTDAENRAVFEYILKLNL